MLLPPRRPSRRSGEGGVEPCQPPQPRAPAGKQQPPNLTQLARSSCAPASRPRTRPSRCLSRGTTREPVAVQAPGQLRQRLGVTDLLHRQHIRRQLDNRGGQRIQLLPVRHLTRGPASAPGRASSAASSGLRAQRTDSTWVKKAAAVSSTTPACPHQRQPEVQLADSSRRVGARSQPPVSKGRRLTNPGS